MDDKPKNVNNKRGGFREGAGRITGTGKFGESTSVIRIPDSQAPVIQNFLSAYLRKKFTEKLDSVREFELPALNPTTVHIPLFSSKVPAGFPSPADDHIKKRLDTNDYLIDQENATFFATVEGDSMINVGLMDGDKAVVDKSKRPINGDIVVAIIYGENTIKTFHRKKDGSIQLLPQNDKYKPIDITEDMGFEIWGVVISSFRRFRKPSRK